MVDFPKDIIKETNRYARRHEIHPQYDWINDYLFEYAKNNLTTKKISEKILNYSAKKDYYFTSNLNETSPNNPYVKIYGDKQNKYSKVIEESYKQSISNQSNLPDSILNYKGASGKKYRHLINNVISKIENPRYLEIGIWTGSTLFSAVVNNKVKFTAIDNWTKGFYGDVKNLFYENLNFYTNSRQEFKIYDEDFQNIDYSSIGKYNIFLYDGPHEEKEQYDGVSLPYDALDDTFILIVDDWNWPGPRNGTLNALNDKKIEILYSIEIRTTSNDYFPEENYLGEQHDWHDGYFIGVCKKNSCIT
jgi:hypothetical protein